MVVVVGMREVVVVTVEATRLPRERGGDVEKENQQRQPLAAAAAAAVAVARVGAAMAMRAGTRTNLKRGPRHATTNTGGASRR